MRRERIRRGAFAIAVLAVGMSAYAVASPQSSPPPGQGFVRVDQVGYASAAPKRAYLMVSAQERGASYTVRDANGTTVFSAPLGAATGRWSSRFPVVYTLDFSNVALPGRYSVTVAGSIPAASPQFAIDGAPALYRTPLAQALSFYGAQRDGPQFTRSALRTAAGHLNDRKAIPYLRPKLRADGTIAGSLVRSGGPIDASGGWWDAGDYLKFVETTSYVADLVLVGVRDFPAEMGSGARASDFTSEARFGLQWLLRMWNDRTRTLYLQVGVGDGNARTAGDHDIWRLPQADDHYRGNDPFYRYIRHRPVFQAGPRGSRVSPNLAGRDAAAFALCFQVFRRTAAGFAARCLRAGENIFALADTHPRRLETTVPFDFYPEQEWRDDLELGATELALALSGGGLPHGLAHTQPAYYLRQAAHWAHAYIARQSGSTRPISVYDVSGLADYELYRAIEQIPTPGLAVGGGALLRSLGANLDSAVAHANTDPFGYGYPWNGSDVAASGAALSVMASEYDALAGSARYRSWAVRWLDGILGANAWGASFVIGAGTTYPQCPQHQVANLAGSLHGQPPVLAGAVVEGPTDRATSGSLPGMRRCPPDGRDGYAPFNGSAVFKDDVQSYSTVEPAIDLTAPTPLAFAWQVREGG